MHRRFKIPAVVFPVIFLASACGTPLRPITPSTLSEHVIQRNYTLGVPQAAYVGQPVVQFNDYFVKIRRNYMRAAGAFHVRQALSPWYEVRADVAYPIQAESMIDGVVYRLVVISGSPEGGPALFVDPDGRPYRQLMFVGPNMKNPPAMIGTASFEPPDVRFVQSPDETVVEATAGFTNYELVYGGTDGRSFTLAYREYSPQDLIRPAFTQQLSYENKSPTIRFRNTKIQVHEVTSEQLSYTVLSDAPDPQ